MPAMDAVVILEQMGLKFVLKGEGKVINQSIKSGSKVDYSKRIIFISHENFKRYYLWC